MGIAGRLQSPETPQKDYGRFGIAWEYASSALLLDGGLVVQLLHGMNTDDPSYVLRIDGESGKTEWKVERRTNASMESPDAYTTSAVVRLGGASQIVITGADVATGHEPASGKEMWRLGGLSPRNQVNFRIVASPVVPGSIVVAPTRVQPMLDRGLGRTDLPADVKAPVGTVGHCRPGPVARSARSGPSVRRSTRPLRTRPRTTRAVGGCTAHGFNRVHGARVAGCFTMKGACHNTGPAAAAAGVLGHFLIGEQDEPFRRENITAVSEAGRPAGAPWAVFDRPLPTRDLIVSASHLAASVITVGAFGLEPSVH